MQKKKNWKKTEGSPEEPQSTTEVIGQFLTRITDIEICGTQNSDSLRNVS